jgi:hypothetical protein
MKKHLTIILIIFPLNLYGQAIHKNNIEGFWIQEKNELQESHDSTSEEETIYKYYTGELVIWIWSYEKTSQIESYKTNFGFYNDCELPSLDSLKREGTYYFEVDSADFADEETTKVNMQNSCGQMNIFTDGKDIMMNIYYSSRQQYVTYKKIDALPANVQEYLQKKGIKRGK